MESLKQVSPGNLRGMLAKDGLGMRADLMPPDVGIAGGYRAFVEQGREALGEHEARIKAFKLDSLEYARQGKLPDIPLRRGQELRTHIDWDSGQELRPRSFRPDRLPQEPYRALRALQAMCLFYDPVQRGRINRDAVSAATWSAHDAGVSWLSMMAGTRDYPWTTVTHADYLRKRKYCGGNWEKAVNNAWAHVMFRSGWMGERGVQGVIPSLIANEFPGVMVWILPTQGFGGASYLSDPWTWDFIEQAGVFSHEGTNLIQGWWEQDMGFREKIGHRTSRSFGGPHQHRVKSMYVGHSYSADAILDLPEEVLNQRGRYWLAAMPARENHRISLGHYGVLEKGMDTMAVLSHFLEGAVRFGGKPLTDILGGGIADYVELAHALDLDIALQEHQINRGVSHVIGYLYDHGGSIRRKRWQDNIAVVLDRLDRLVDFERVLDHLLTARFPENQIVPSAGGHYAFSSKNANVRQVHQALLVNQIRQFLYREIPY